MSLVCSELGERSLTPSGVCLYGTSRPRFPSIEIYCPGLGQEEKVHRKGEALVENGEKNSCLSYYDLFNLCCMQPSRVSPEFRTSFTICGNT